MMAAAGSLAAAYAANLHNVPFDKLLVEHSMQQAMNRTMTRRRGDYSDRAGHNLDSKTRLPNPEKRSRTVAENGDSCEGALWTSQNFASMLFFHLLLSKLMCTIWQPGMLFWMLCKGTMAQSWRMARQVLARLTPFLTSYVLEALQWKVGRAGMLLVFYHVPPAMDFWHCCGLEHYNSPDCQNGTLVS